MRKLKERGDTVRKSVRIIPEKLLAVIYASAERTFSDSLLIATPVLYTLRSAMISTTFSGIPAISTAQSRTHDPYARYEP